MPIGNMLAAFGNRPSIMQEAEAQRANQMQNSLAQYRLSSAIRDEQKQNRLGELYGRYASGDKSAMDEMATVSPEWHMQIQKNLMEMEKGQREQLAAQLEESGRIALMADTPETWAQNFPDMPFEQRGAFITRASAAKGVFEAIQKQEEQAYQQQKDAQAFDLQRRGQDITLRGQDLTNQRAIESQGRPTDKMREAQSLGYMPGTPEYENYMKGGNRGALSATAQKELFEADELAQSSKNAITLLNEAKNLNNQAYSGFGAKGRAVIMSNLPGQYEGADATVQLDNIMTSQALESLKAIFGGMPTEGERKILLDMQASADKTPTQRQQIIDRAIEAANRRLEFNSRKAESLRSGNYFTDQSGNVSIKDPEQDWINRAMQANPDMSRDQVIEEGRRLGKIR